MMVIIACAQPGRRVAGALRFFYDASPLAAFSDAELRELCADGTIRLAVGVPIPKGGIDALALPGESLQDALRRVVADACAAPPEAPPEAPAKAAKRPKPRA